MRIDVPGFVFVFAPKPPKVDVVLALFWPKPPPPKPNDMLGDAADWWCCVARWKWSKPKLGKKARGTHALRVGSQIANGVPKNPEIEAENAMKKSTGCAIGAWAGQHRVLSTWKKMRRAVKAKLAARES